MSDSNQVRHAAIAELAKNDAQRSYTAQIRDVYEAIESALASGISRTAIHAKLVDTGLTISLRHFDQALYRIRKSRKAANSAKRKLPNKIAEMPVSETSTIRSGALINEAGKNQGNFRQNLKQIREKVENTNWAEIINNQK